jgi:hypothetical protein
MPSAINSTTETTTNFSTGIPRQETAKYRNSPQFFAWLCTGLQAQSFFRNLLFGKASVGFRPDSRVRLWI